MLILFYQMFELRRGLTLQLTALVSFAVASTFDLKDFVHMYHQGLEHSLVSLMCRFGIFAVWIRHLFL